MIQGVPRRSITVLGVLVIAVLPTVLIIAVRHSLSWYAGVALFYGILAVAEIGYLCILVAIMRRDGERSLAAVS
ncbi:hypothetical protein G3T14_09470 [Methylobacterium sp. BTF04]|uniref:hypothetical protein n=1 Tax=Methylobacterium sp. BTF04 TaxID=2708300 RepID=UPI0013D01946|nr:hypothetical protein [Methylobacterium sp. BTF04]NEU12363.1 hypothetical protein [Methylobacterium sp. BTF04]